MSYDVAISVGTSNQSGTIPISAKQPLDVSDDNKRVIYSMYASQADPVAGEPVAGLF